MSKGGGADWDACLCSSVGALIKSSSLAGSRVLRIAVGNGGTDNHDLVLFMILAGNGNGDFGGLDLTLVRIFPVVTMVTPLYVSEG